MGVPVTEKNIRNSNEVLKEQFVKKVIVKYSRGNVSLQQGRYITEGRIKERLQKARQFTFSNL